MTSNKEVAAKIMALEMREQALIHLLNGLPDGAVLGGQYRETLANVRKELAKLRSDHDHH